MKAKTIAILYDKYYDFDNRMITVGGIQTYITDLTELCKSSGFNVKIYQMGDNDRTEEVYGVVMRQIKTKPCDYQVFVNKIFKLDGDRNALVIYATDTIIPRRNPFSRTIAIQHGICWDIPRAKKRPEWMMQLIKARRNHLIFSRIARVNAVVCVDYNFINWLRAQTDRIDTHLQAIPNYTRITSENSKPEGRINIIFARRLWWYRGTRVFAEAIKPILEKYDNVHVTIAGNGPDEQYMRSQLDKYNNVEFAIYESSDSLTVHADKHIAVVPTVGSEGTSLSLLEGMSSQCAVIATNVGGMTNIILNGYNGLLVNAGDSSALSQAMEALINDPLKMRMLSEKGYETVKTAFSIERWKDQWKNIILNQVSKND